MTTISKKNLSFLKNLAKNNNRDWFNENKSEFKIHEKEAKVFFATVQEELRKSDDIESHKIMRIYRDVRFSKDKTPYKARFAGSFKRATAKLKGEYWLNIEPGQCMVGGGFYGPEPKDLMRIRKEFELDDSEIRDILNDSKFKTTFGELRGEELKTAPRGFDKTHPAIDLIKKKQFYVMKSFTDAEMISENFVKQVVETFKILRQFFDYMSDVLTTDLNGESSIME
ncbi:MAG: DUF2461 domain-containing protein [Flavobacteriaceae bacterium]|nr:DUF2461 domain-containing protein [Flavobacteriaceae bacterium]